MLELDDSVAIGQALRSSLAHGCAPALRAVSGLMARASPEELIGGVLEGDAADTVMGAVAALDHFGFMAPPEVDEGLGPAAREAGFSEHQWRIPSTILARELSRLAGGDEVPTTIFKASGRSPEGAPLMVEVATPRGVGEEVVRGWIGAGVGAHAAFRVSAAADLERIAAVLGREGFAMPDFMIEPLTNPYERLMAVYFDRPAAPLPLRLEFCHYLP